MLSITALLFASKALVSAQKLPTAEFILDRFVSVTGGEAAYAKRHSDFSSGTMEIIGFGIKGTIRTYRLEPNLSYSEMDLPALGKGRQGTSGKVAWILSPIHGPMVKTAVAPALNIEAHWRDHFKQVEVLGTENIEGKPAYVVIKTPQQGLPITDYYDVDTGLLVKVVEKQSTANGEAQTEILPSDYRIEDGLLVAHQITKKMAGQEYVYRHDTYKLNAPLPEGIFDLPAEIKTLLAEKNQNQ